MISIKFDKQQLAAIADEQGVKAAQRFHKEVIKTYGIKVPVVRALAKEWFQDIASQGKIGVFRLCEELLQSGFIEEAQVAFDWTFLLRRQFEESDITTFERWITHHIHNWASCDTFCNNSMGAFLIKYPAHVVRLKKWAGSPNRWLQRAAAVSLIIPVRKGLFLQEAFEIADLLLLSDDDLVQKGYGWLLKVSSKIHFSAVYAFVRDRRDRMPRTAFRYAIELFPETKKKLLMK